MGNAMEKRCIRIITKSKHWPFQDIYKTRYAEQFVDYEQNI